GKRRVEQRQAIEERRILLRPEAAQEKPVIARIGAELLAANAGRVAQDLVKRLGLLVANLVGADHRDGLRYLAERGVGFGAAKGAVGDIAVHRPLRIFNSSGRTAIRRLW